jgi:hypothetical protein
VTPYSSCKNRRFTWPNRLLHQDEENQLLVTGILVPSSPTLLTLMMEAIRSSKTSVLTRATERHFPEDGILHSHRRENLRSYNVNAPMHFLAELRKIRKTREDRRLWDEFSTDCLRNWRENSARLLICWTNFPWICHVHRTQPVSACIAASLHTVEQTGFYCRIFHLTVFSLWTLSLTCDNVSRVVRCADTFHDMVTWLWWGGGGTGLPSALSSSKLSQQV